MKRNGSVKHALILSMLSVLMCTAMLVGTTFAWFTDTASTGANKITAGNLHVEIQDKTGKKIEKLEWVKEDGTPIANQEAILWEPGCTYLLTPFKIVNTGNLALKYKIVITGLDGDSPLLDVIKFTYTTESGNKFDIDAEGHLSAFGTDGAQTELITVSAHMETTADSSYQSKTLDNVRFTVYAAQDTVENDSFGSQYDQNAEYDKKIIIVNDAAGLTAAIQSADGDEIIRLGQDITADNAISIGKKLTLDLSGFTLSTTASKTLKLASGADVTVIDTSKTASGVITNAYAGSADPTTIDLAAKGAAFTLASGTVQSNAKDDLYSVAIGSSGKATSCTVTVNGGTVANPQGHVKSRAIVASKGMTVNINDGTISGGLYALDVYDGSVSSVFGGKLSANAADGRSDKYGTSYAIHVKGVAEVTIGSEDSALVPNVKGIKFESNGPKTALPTICLVKGEITNPVYSLEPKYNYQLFKLGIVADAPVTFVDDTAQYFLPDDLQMVQNGSLFTVTAK